MTENIELELQNLALEVAGLQDRLDRTTALLEQISDGFFYLNLHIGAPVTPWVPDRATRGAADAAPVPARGRVKWFDATKGFGFLTDDDGGPDVFVHYESLRDGLTSLEEGQKVEFDVVSGTQGPMAENVRVEHHKNWI